MRYKNLFRKIARNKKGFDDDLTDIITGAIFIAIIFIVVFIFIANKGIKTEKATEQEKDELEKGYILLNYLRTPMRETDLTVAEYLASLSKEEREKSMSINGFCYEGTSKEGLLVRETKEIFQGIAKWQVKMLIVGRKEFCSITKDIKTQRGEYVAGETVKAIIPSNDPEFNIEVYFTNG